MYLNCKTYYSFRYGTFSTAALVEMAVNNGVTALALTNINCTCDLWDFVKLCREGGIKPLAGVEVRNEDKLLYLLLAANNNGLVWINEFIADHLLHKQPFPEPFSGQPFFNDSWDGFVIYPFGTKPLDDLLANERIGVLPWEVNKLYAVDLKKYADKFVIRQPVTFQNKRYFNLHRLLRAIDRNILLSMLPKEAQAAEGETFVALSELLHAFKQYPFIVTNTYKLTDACSIEMDYKGDKNKLCYSASKEDDMILLGKLALDGFIARYGKQHTAAHERLQKELRIIDTMGFNAYFLINWDIVRYAQSRGFYHVGRGSGANSIVAYCLGITDLDPIELNLYFERFLNPERTSPPDFDIDFSHRDRDKEIDYIFKRYGKDHVAWLGAYATFQHSAIIRELGKVFGLPEEEIKAVQRSG